MAPLDGSNIDPNVKVPAAVRRAAKRAEEISAEVYHPEAPPADPAPVGDPPADPAPVGDPPADFMSAAPAPGAEDYEQKYRTLQGKYDAEVPSMRRELDALRNLVATMQAPPAPAPEPRRETITTVVPDRDPADVETYGAELLDVIERRATAIARARVAHLEEKVNHLENVQTNHQAQTAVERITEALAREVGPHFEDINHDPAFMNWLAEVDPLFGVPRNEGLQAAFRRGDAPRVVKFFKTFIEEHTATRQPSPTPVPTQTPTAMPQVAGAPSLADMVAPGRANRPSPAPLDGAPADKRTWTRAEISRFYREVQLGKWNHREADRRRMEEDIFAASLEGRVLN